jgi:hypothetical protein
MGLPKTVIGTVNAIACCKIRFSPFYKHL